MPSLRSVPFSGVADYAPAALVKDARVHTGVVIDDRPGDAWFQIVMPEGQRVGCLGLRRQNMRCLRIVGVYVEPAARGAGVGSKATEEAIAIAVDAGLVVEAVAYNPAWYVARGFRIVRQYLHGALVRLS